MEMKTALAFKDRRVWRSWLEKNGARDKEVWVIFYNWPRARNSA